MLLCKEFSCRKRVVIIETTGTVYVRCKSDPSHWQQASAAIFSDVCCSIKLAVWHPIRCFPSRQKRRGAGTPELPRSTQFFRRCWYRNLAPCQHAPNTAYVEEHGRARFIYIYIYDIYLHMCVCSCYTVVVRHVKKLEGREKC